MFKRLREGLLGRTEETPPEEMTPPQPDQAAEPAQASQQEEASARNGAQATDTIAPTTQEQSATTPAQELAQEPSQEGAMAQASATTDEAAAITEETYEDAYAEDEADEYEYEEQEATAKRGFLRNPFHFSLGRTRQLFGRVNEALEHDDITDDLWDELEETLITGDVGVQTTDKLMQVLHDRVEAEHLTRGRELRDALKEELEILLGDPEPLVFSDTSPISVFLVVGVNGVGKTTSIAKLANLLKRQKHRVMLAAGDTFRAAATEQIKTWGERIGVPVISHQHGADPGAVVYDAMQAAQARGTDVLIVDTAGRLHTKFNLMEELKKIMKVLQKYDPEAPHEVLLVIDATTGQNGFAQAKQFVQDSGVSGIILTKLDGTARGGIVFAVASELGLPIKYIGTGEKLGDIAPFDPVQFVDALFEDE